MIPDTSHIKSIADIKEERLRAEKRINYYEKELKRKFQELPAELAAAGVNSVIPSFLKGKVTNTAVNGGKFLLNKLFVSEDNSKPSLIGQAKKPGIIPIVKTVLKLFKGR